jgi:hypothetical protein
MAFCLTLSALATDFTVNGVAYTITDAANRMVAVGTGIVYSPAIDNTTSGAITIPQSVAFNGETYTVTSIADFAFYVCEQLTTIDLPVTITSIGSKAFMGCSGLTALNIPDQVTSIGQMAFMMCRSLPSITIPGNVTTIGERAFSNCWGITSITIPASVTSVGISLFQMCAHLPEINVDANNPKFSSRDGVLFNKDQTILLEYPDGSPRLSYTIPSSVNELGKRAFNNNYELAEIIIPSSVTSIDSNAINSSINIAIHVNNVNPSSIYLEYGVFEGLDLQNEDTKLYVPKGCKDRYSLANQWMDFVTIVEESVTFTVGGVTYDITDGVNSTVAIGTGKAEAAISTSTGGAFNIPTSVDWYGTNFIVTSIGNHALYNCSALTSLIIPSLVTSIGNSSFSGCSGLNAIQTNQTNPSMIALGAQVFQGVPSSCTIYVPAGSKAAYQAADQWSNFSIEEKTLFVSSNTANIGADDGSTASISVYAISTWTASSDQSWLTVSPTSAAGNGSLTFTAAANPTAADRIATVTISTPGETSQTVTVTQAAGPATLGVSATTVSLGAEANSTGTVDVTSNTSWTVFSNQPWLTVSPTSASGNCTLTLTAEANPTAAIRGAIVTVSVLGETSEVIIVDQAEGKATLNVSPSLFIVDDASGNSAVVNVISNTSWNANSNQAWLTASPSSGSGNGTFTLTAESNTSSVERTAEVTVSAPGTESQIVRFTQLALENALNFDGVNDYVAIPDNDDPITSAFTIEACCIGLLRPVPTLILYAARVTNKWNYIPGQRPIICVSSPPRGFTSMLPMCSRLTPGHTLPVFTTPPTPWPKCM